MEELQRTVEAEGYWRSRRDQVKGLEESQWKKLNSFYYYAVL